MDINVLQCHVCGNTNGAHFKHLSKGYICLHCNAYHYYVSEEEEDRCREGFTKIREYHFSDAEDMFAQVLLDFPNSVSARWGLLLARFGIVEIKGFYEKKVYENGETAFASKPIYCFQRYEKWKHKTFRTEMEYLQLQSLLANEREALSVCERKAAEIDRALEEFKNSRNKPERDIFICVKISNATELHPENIGKTKDFEEAQKLYEELSKAGKKVFFSFVTLKGDMIKADYQIWTNLLKSKKMLLVASKREFLQSAWVKSEWKRWLYLKREASLYIYALTNEPYEILPSELSELDKFIYTPETRRKLIKDICENETEISPISVSQPEPMKAPRKRKKRILPIILAGALLIGAAVGGMYAFRDTLFLPKKNDEISFEMHKNFKDAMALALCFGSGHEIVIDADKAATCTETGLTEGKHCEKCGEVLLKQEIIPAAHSLVIDAGKAATCTESGLTEGKHCSVCDAVLVKQETIAAKGHTVVIDAAKAPTCTEMGLTAGKHCSVCNAILEAQTTVASKGHTVVLYEAVAPTCTDVGYTQGQGCSVCGEFFVKPQSIAAKGHTVITTAGKAATCTESGLTEGKSCSVCHAVLAKQTILNALGHTVVSDIGKAATCTETGLTEGKHCSVCDTVLVGQSIVMPTGHNHVSGKCEACGDIQKTDIGYFSFTLLHDGTYGVAAKDVLQMPAHIVIPSIYQGRAVTKIMEKGFVSYAETNGGTHYMPSNLESVQIPESVIHIGERAFYNSINLTEVQFSSHLKSIGDYAFYNTDVAELIIPGSVENIGDWAFGYCDNLKTVMIEEGIGLEIGWLVFSGCSNLEKVFIPKSLRKMGLNPFSLSPKVSVLIDVNNPYYTWLNHCLIEIETGTLVIGNENSVIPTNGMVKKIGYDAFRSTDITDLYIPNGVTDIDTSAFAYCRSLRTLYIPETVSYIGTWVFLGCPDLTLSISPNNPYYYVENNCLIERETGALLWGNASNGVIPDGVKSLETLSLECAGLTAITVPKSVTSINISAFNHCESLTAIVFEGTRAEWNAISFDTYNNIWNKDLTIQCTDGVLYVYKG